MKNYAFIDGQNLNLGIQNLGWKLDYRRFRRYLKEKYKVEKAYYFIGYIESNERLYETMKNYGYELIFKPIIKDDKGNPKGNCDADLVLKAMIEFDNFEKAVIVTGDGDFYCLVKYFLMKGKFLKLLSPNHKISYILRKSSQGRIDYISELRKKLEFKKKMRGTL